MRNNGDKANDMIEKQSRYAGMAADELIKLEGAQKRAAEGELAKQLNLQNAQLQKSQNEFLLLTQSISDNNKQSAEAYRIWAELKAGVIDVNQAFNRLNQLSFINSDQINQLADSKKKVDENSKAVKQTNSELNQVRASGANAKAGFNDVSQGAKGAVQDVSELNKKLQDLQKTYAQKNLDTDFSLINIKSHGLEMGKALSDFYDNNKIPKTRSLTKDEWAIFQKNFDKVQELKKLEEDIADSKRQQTKESAKQAVLLAGNNERVRNMLRVYQAFRNAGLGDKQARVMTAQVGRENDFRNEAMFGSHKDENNGYTNTGFISWQKTRSSKLMQSLQGQGVLDKNGKIQQTQDALDAQAKFLLQEVMTNKSYSKTKSALLNDDLDYRSLEKIVGKNFIGWDYEGKKLGKDKASQHLAKQDSYYNQLNKILGASPDAASKAIGDLSKFEDEAYKARAKTLEEIKQLQASYDSDSVARSKKREEEINKATILGQSNLIPKINERYDAEDKLAQKQFDFEVNGYKWTEEEKLKYTKETSALRLVAEGKLSKEQLDIAKEGLDQQYQHELELINLTKAARQSAYDQANLKALQELKQQRDLLAAPLGQRAGLSLQFDERNALSENDNDLINKGSDLKVQLEQKEITTLEYNKRIEDAVRLHEETKHKIQEEYAEKYRDLQNNQYQAELGMYNNLLSQASNVWGGVTQLIKESAGEQSAAYKTMFLMQQAMAIASALVSTHLAAAQVMADPSALTLAQKTSYAAMITGLGYANVGLIAAQTIAGFSDGGYTGNGLKHTPAGIVHKGEVVWSQEDIKRWGGVSVVESMRQSKPSGYANGGYVSNNTSEAIAARREARQFDAINSGRTEKSQPTVTIINKTSEKVDATSEWDGKELTVILKEYQKQNEAMVDAKIEKRFRMSKRQGW